MRDIFDLNMFKLNPSPIDERDYTLPHVGGDEALDDFIVSFGVHPTHNQGPSSMCTGFAISGIQEYYSGERFSPAFLYGNREEGDYEGEGEVIREALMDWYRDGICRFEDFPLIGDVGSCIKEFDNLPDEVKEYAKTFKIESFYQLNKRDPQGAFELMEMFNLPILAGIPLYDSFGDAFDDNGVVPVPNTESDVFLGGHAVRFVGKKTIDGLEYYIMANSWGDDIPDAGFQYIPIDYPVWELWLPLPYVKKEILLTANEQTYFVNGQEFQMDTKPVNKNSRVYVPLRFVLEAIGNIYIEWHNLDRTAYVYRGGDVLYFPEGSDGFFSEYATAWIKYEDDESRTGLTVNYIDENDRMMIPVRKICEFLGCSVDYNHDTKVITITN